MKPSEVLEGAANEIEKRGLGKGDYYKSGKFCSVGAIRYVITGQVYGLEFPTPLAVEVEGSLHQDIRKTNPSCTGITIWNDTPSRRTGDVVRKMRKVARKLKEEGK